MNYNYNYAKFINNELQYAPKILIIGEKMIINPTEEHFIMDGFQKIVKSKSPYKEGYHFMSKIVEIDGIPTQKWEEYPIESREKL